MRREFCAKEESLDKKSDAIERREAAFTAKEEHLRQREAKVEELSKQRVQELERISGLTSEQAKEYLLKTVEDDVKHDTAKMIKEMESTGKGRSRQEGKGICCYCYPEMRCRSCSRDHDFGCTASE